MTAVKALLLVSALSVLVGFALAHASETVVVNKTFNGREVEIKAGGSIQVELEQLGAAGYTWEIEGLDDEHFEVVGITTAEPAGTGRAIGGPVLKTWLIRAKATGKSELKLIHFRPWEGKEKAADTFVLKVSIL